MITSAQTNCPISAESPQRTVSAKSIMTGVTTAATTAGFEIRSENIKIIFKIKKNSNLNF